MSPIAIDPVTRAGGQLRVELEVSGGAVDHAVVSATMFRGFEHLLVGRDPRDAWQMAQRICGTCTGVHALASVRAVENALGIQVPRNARILRNILGGTMLVRDHVMTFYQRALPDWVDLRSAATADPFATATLAKATSAWPFATPDHFRTVRERLAAMIGSNQPGPFGGDWWGHPAYLLSPEQNLLLAAHMLDALDWQREFLRIEALLGGKDPHPQTYLVGGMSLAPPWGGPAASRNRQHPQVPDRDAPTPLSSEGLDLVEGLVANARIFVDQVLAPDARLLVDAYPEYLELGRGVTSYLAFGEFPLSDAKSPTLFLPNGRLMEGRLEAPQPAEEEGVAESALHAWFAFADGDDKLRRPIDGLPQPSYTAAVPLESLDPAGKYSWVKGARYDGLPMEAGPAARMMVGVADGQNQVTLALGTLLNDMGTGLEALQGTVGRHLARAVEAGVVAGELDVWIKELRENLATGDVSVANVELWDPTTWPAEALGVSLGEGPRGAVGHWLTIRDGRIASYQVVDGSTWNAAPRDNLALAGPVEKALAGVPIADQARPVEAMRVIHSFAPCAACAAHVCGPDASTVPQVRVHHRETVR